MLKIKLELITQTLSKVSFMALILVFTANFHRLFNIGSSLKIYEEDLLSILNRALKKNINSMMFFLPNFIYFVLRNDLTRIGEMYAFGMLFFIARVMNSGGYMIQYFSNVNLIKACGYVLTILLTVLLFLDNMGFGGNLLSNGLTRNYFGF